MFRRSSRSVRDGRLGAGRRPVAVPAIALSLALLAMLSIGLSIAGPTRAAAAMNDGPDPVPVSSANARWLASAYVELLGRSADPAGLDYHLSRISAGGRTGRQTTAYGLLFGNEGSRQEVRRAYGQLLGRPADRTGEDFWTAHLTGHGVLDLRVLLMAGDEYHRRAGGTDRGWLIALYRDVLGRSPDDPGMTYWLDRLAAGLPRASAAGAIANSDEAMARRAEAYYRELLGRAPTDAERQRSVVEIRRFGERHLRARLWASDDIYGRYLSEAWS